MIKTTIYPKRDTWGNKDALSFSMVQEVAKIGTWEADLIANTVFWSNTTKKIHEVPLSYTPNIADGISFYKEGYHRALITDVFTKCVEHNIPFDEELIIITFEGKEKWVRAIGKGVRKNGVCVNVYGLFQDIHDKKIASLKLEASEERFKSTFQNAPNGIALIGLNGDWLKVNSKVYKMLGYNKKQFLSKSLEELTHPDDLDKDASYLTKIFEGRTSTYQIQKRYFHKNGNIIWTILSVSAVRDAHNKAIYFIAQIIDITSVIMANQKINGLLSVTSKQNEKLLNFAHIVSHNLNSHVTNLDMLVNFLETDLPEIKNEKVFPLLKSALGNLQETITNLNEIATIKNTNQDLFENVFIEDALNTALKSINAITNKEKIKIQKKLNGQKTLKGLPAYLDSIFLNLLTNAVKYKDPNRNLEIDITTKNKGNYVVIKFKDNGLGIDLKQNKHKIFGMYKTFHGNKNARGLGLFITKNQVEAMNGTITVKSKPGIGSIFTLKLIK